MEKCGYFPRHESVPVCCTQDALYMHRYHQSVFGKPMISNEYTCEEHKWSDELVEEDALEIRYWDDKIQTYETIWVCESVNLDDYYEEF